MTNVNLMQTLLHPLWYYIYILVVLLLFPMALEFTRCYNVRINIAINSSGVNYLKLMRSSLNPATFAFTYMLLILPIVIPVVSSDGGLVAVSTIKTADSTQLKIINGVLSEQLHDRSLRLNIITILICPLIVMFIGDKLNNLSKLKISLWRTYLKALIAFVFGRLILIIVEMARRLFNGGTDIAAIYNASQGFALAFIVSWISFRYYSHNAAQLKKPKLHLIIMNGYRQERFIIYTIYAMFIFFHTFIVSRFSAIDAKSAVHGSNITYYIPIIFIVGFALVSVVALYNELKYGETEKFKDRIRAIGGHDAVIPGYRELLDKHIIHRSGYIMLIGVVGSSIAFSLLKLYSFFAQSLYK